MKNPHPYLYFFYIAAATVILPAISGLIHYRGLRRELKLLTAFMVVATAVEGTALVFQQNGWNNYPILHLFTLIELAFILLIYKEALLPFISERGVYGVIAGFTLFSVINSLFIQSVFKFNSLARGVEFILILLAALIHLFSLLTREDFKWKSDPMFWVSSSVLIYYASNFFVVLLVSFSRALNEVWTVHNVFLLLHYLLFTFALWIRPAR